jgi:hypothetical protein
MLDHRIDGKFLIECSEIFVTSNFTEVELVLRLTQVAVEVSQRRETVTKSRQIKLNDERAVRIQAVLVGVSKNVFGQPM